MTELVCLVSATHDPVVESNVIYNRIEREQFIAYMCDLESGIQVCTQ